MGKQWLWQSEVRTVSVSALTLWCGAKWKLAKPGYKSLGHEKGKGAGGTQILYSLTGLSSTRVLECFTEPWGGAGQVPGVQHFAGSLLCPWDAPGAVQALGSCSCPPWEPGFEQRKSYRALMLITLYSGM